MNARRFAMVAALIGLVVLSGLLVLRGGAPAATGTRHQIVLADGKTVEGTMLRLEPGRYLVQSETRCLILTADEIRKIDGKAPAPDALPTEGSIPRTQETFESISPGGVIELRSTIAVVNRGETILSKVDWGVAAHEIGQLERTRVIDAYGNETPMKVEDDPSIQGKRVRVEFARPVLPGEQARLTTIIAGWSAVKQEGSSWHYKMNGDYPDDRLVTRSVQLPSGARVVSISPEPAHTVTVAGRTLVIWRRYFVPGEVIPWEIRYEL